jgi:hypothetical protein
VPLKWLAFLLVTWLVLFPNPVRFARHVRHLSNLDAMVQPEAPELAAWGDELRQRLLKLGTAKEASNAPLSELSRRLAVPPARIQREVEQFVYEKIAYAWDWDTWGDADYMPTVGEMFAAASQWPNHQLREDCDGRAVMAASLMRRLGYESRLVTDLRHVWVATPQGQWMGPGRAETVVSSPRGNRVNLQTALGNIAASLSYGAAVFPLWRELLIAATAYLLGCHRRMSPRMAALGGVLLLQGVLFLHGGVPSLGNLAQSAMSWPAVVGLVHLTAGFLVLGVASRRARRLGRTHLLPAVGPAGAGGA